MDLVNDADVVFANKLSININVKGYKKKNMIVFDGKIGIGEHITKIPLTKNISLLIHENYMKIFEIENT